MTPLKKRHTNWIEAYPIRQRIKNAIWVTDTNMPAPLHGHVEFSRQKIPDRKKQEHVPKTYVTGHQTSSPRVCRYPDVSRSLSVDLGIGFVKSLKKRSVYYVFRVDQQIARTDSEDENSDSHSRSTIVGANISLSVIHHPSIRIHINFIAYNCSF
jgi:hypothetical protein